MEGLGPAGGSWVVEGTDCVDSCADRGNLNVEEVGELDVLGVTFVIWVSMLRSVGRGMVVEREGGLRKTF